MTGVVRKTDNCSGHDDWPPRPPSSWSFTVFANKLNVIRFGDTWESHCNLVPLCHGGSSIGTGSVYVEGKEIQIIGDGIDCGSTCANGSSNVFAKGADQ